jgi:LytS/YehU family sensor histidine kinase
MQTLDEQIAWLHRYAYILETRHAGRLAFRWKIADDARAVLVPWLLLQPLIENAVKHGALRRPRGGEVTVSAKLVAEHLRSSRLNCTIEDSGPGLPEGDTRRSAFGLFAVRRQLALKYGDEAHLRLESSSSGTRAIVELPAQWKSASRRAS